MVVKLLDAVTVPSAFKVARPHEPSGSRTVCVIPARLATERSGRVSALA